MKKQTRGIKGRNGEIITTWDELELYFIEQDKEIERLNNIIKYTDSWIDRTIEIIKQQPSEDDTWILERLNGIKQCLKGSDKE